MNKIFERLKDFNVIDYWEKNGLADIQVDGINGGVKFIVIAEDNNFKNIKSVEIFASANKIGSDENYFERDIVEKLIQAIIHSNIYLKKASKTNSEKNNIFNWIFRQNNLNNLLYIIGVNCTQEEVDKMEGLVRLNFEKS